MNILIIAFLIPAVILGAGIAININLNASLIDNAEHATQSMQQQFEQEEKLQNKPIEINDKVYNSIDEYIQSEE